MKDATLEPRELTEEELKKLGVIVSASENLKARGAGKLGVNKHKAPQEAALKITVKK